MLTAGYFHIMKRCLNTHPASGFSLVEVTLAVAIAALAVITLLGLLPQGLEMSRKTAIITSSSNILEQIIRDLENARFTTLPTAVERKYFNDQGGELEQNSQEIVFVVEIDPAEPATLPQSEATQPYLRRFIIRLATSGNPDFQFEEDNRMSYTIFNHLVAKTR
jgi:uncharacterized protein (TIGR02598 family)